MHPINTNYILPWMLIMAHRFDDLNTEKLRMAARQSRTEIDLFYFDPKEIDWEDYFMNTHIPGLVKYIFK